MAENEVEQTPEIPEEPLAPATRRPWVRSLILGIVILICGAVIGAAGTVVAAKHCPLRQAWQSGRFPEHIAEHMREKYGLTAEQEQELATIFAEHGQKLADIRAEVQPRVEAEHEALRNAVEAILTAEQAAQWRAEFDQMRRPWRHGDGEPRWQHRRGRHGQDKSDDQKEAQDGAEK